MDIESFILSVRNRRALWDQQAIEHHNRYTLERLWKEISQENNCTVKEAQKKWKTLRDYFRKEFRKMQMERSGQGADTSYKSNWPYFMLMNFIRGQFKTQPSSDNIKEHGVCSDDSGPESSVVAEREVSDNNYGNYEDNGSDESQFRGTDFESISQELPPTEARTSAINQNEGFIYPNDFQRKKFRYDRVQKFVQLEEQKLSMLEKNREEKEERMNVSNDEDFKFFESLLPHVKLIDGVHKLMFRNDVHNLVMKYAYSAGNVHSETPRSSSVYDFERSSSRNNPKEGDAPLSTSTTTPRTID